MGLHVKYRPLAARQGEEDKTYWHMLVLGLLVIMVMIIIRLG